MAGRPKVRKDLALLSTITTGDADSIFERAATAEPLYRIAASLNVGLTALHEWIDASPERIERLKRARERKASVLADETLEIADKGARASATDATAESAGEPDVQRDKLRIQARQWLASRLDRTTYGDSAGPQVVVNMNTLHLDSLRRQQRATIPTEPLHIDIASKPSS